MKRQKEKAAPSAAPKSAASRSAARQVAGRNVDRKVDAGAGKSSQPAWGVDPALVRELAQVLGDTHLTEIEVRHGALRIRVSRQAAPVAMAQHVVPQAVVAPPPHAIATPAAAGAPASAASDVADHPGVVKSPMVGTAYSRPNPDAKAFVEIGSQVKSGDKIFLVEAMKTFNEVVAPRAGTVTQILVEDGQPVEYGQPLIVIE